MRIKAICCVLCIFMFIGAFLTEVPATGNIQMKEEWVVRYDGPSSGSDSAYAIAVDPSSGNVYVTGSSEGLGTGYDIIILAYDPLGNELWTARYNGPGNGFDRAYAIALDSSRNIYVTGWSDGIYSPNSMDYATIAYDSSGNQLWVSRYNGPANSNDDATSIITDEENVYVTGFSYGGFPSNGGTDTDFATIAYYLSNGTQRWVARYNGPANRGDLAQHIAIDSLGNVIVFGQSENDNLGSQDFVTIAYYPTNGTQKWLARYDGPQESVDSPSGLAVDLAGNVVVTGWSDKGVTNMNFTTIKYDENGNQLWVTIYNGPENGDDIPKDICTDTSGNIYVTGNSYVNTTNSYDYTTVAYDPMGNELWQSRYNGPQSSRDQTSAIVCDQFGNLFVTGMSKGIGTDYDYATVGYDSMGNEICVLRYNDPGNYPDWAEEIALDSAGNIIVTGISWRTPNTCDIITIKYSHIQPNIQGAIDIDPDTLNLKSKGRWIICYIDLPGYDVNNIDISTILLEDTIPAEWGDIQGDKLMVKFDRSEVEDMLSPGTYNLKVTGELTDGTSFEGYSDEIRVIDPGK